MTTRARAAVIGAGFFTVLAISVGATPGGWTPGFCLFNWLTGIPCPSCGMTRAFVALSHGQFVAALHLNPVAPVVYLGAWTGFGLSIADAAFATSFVGSAWAWLTRPMVAGAVVGMLLAGWIVKLVGLWVLGAGF